MALFDTTAPRSLSEVLGQRADYQASKLSDQYAQQKRRLAGQQAASGRLLSPVSNYNFSDLATGQASDLGDIYSNLAGSLGEIPSEDLSNINDYNNNLKLAKLIGDMNKPSQLEEILGSAKTLGTSAAQAIAAIYGA